jgi:hypothetical protein
LPLFARDFVGDTSFATFFVGDISFATFFVGDISLVVRDISFATFFVGDIVKVAILVGDIAICPIIFFRVVEDGGTALALTTIIDRWWRTLIEQSDWSK